MVHGKSTLTGAFFMIIAFSSNKNMTACLGFTQTDTEALICEFQGPIVF